MDRLIWLGTQSWLSSHPTCCCHFLKDCDHAEWLFLGFGSFIATDLSIEQLDPASPNAAHMYFNTNGNDPTQMAIKIGIVHQTDSREQILMHFDDSAAFLLHSDKVQSVVLWERNPQNRCPSSLMIHLNHMALNIYNGTCSIPELAKRFATILKVNISKLDSSSNIDDPTDKMELEELLSASRMQMQQYMADQEQFFSTATKLCTAGDISLPLVQVSMEMRHRKIGAEKLRHSLLLYSQQYQEEKQASKNIDQITQLDERISRVLEALLDMEIITA